MNIKKYGYIVLLALCVGHTLSVYLMEPEELSSSPITSPYQTSAEETSDENDFLSNNKKRWINFKNIIANKGDRNFYLNILLFIQSGCQ